MKQAIGFIDSGIGGLTVLKEALKQLPYESVIYLGDSARCPYGPRPVEEVVAFTWEMVDFLMQKNVKMIVIACNTATAAALDQLRASLPIPVVGVIHPGSLTAIKQTVTNRIGVIGTEGTIRSGIYQQTMELKNHNVTIFNLACPKFVSLVESNQTASSLAKKVVAETLQPLLYKNIDTLVLGCTHYPLLRQPIQNVMGPTVQLVDSGVETVNAVSTLLDYFGIAENYTTNPKPTQTYYTTGSAKLFKELAQAWLKQDDLQVEKVTLQRGKIHKGVKNMSEPFSKELVIATKNAGKAVEFRTIFEPLGYRVKTLLDFPEVEDVVETGTTFEENARLKAETIASTLKRMVIADDSGLLVDVLQGEPGVYSARYAGADQNDAANNAKLLSVLGSMGENTDRSARFHCTLVLAAPNVESLVVKGEVEGEIAHVPNGDNGFGYDPLFYIADLQKTFAQLTSQEKNAISHRAKAIQALMEHWEQWYKKNKVQIKANTR